MFVLDWLNFPIGLFDLFCLLHLHLGLTLLFISYFIFCSYTLPNLLGCQVPNKASSASYSFSSRRKVGAPTEDLAMSPGPAKYNSINPDLYLQRQPSFSLQSRTKRPNYSFANPGPGTYNPEKFHMHLPKPPSYSLGVRHSEFVTPLVVDVAEWQILQKTFFKSKFVTQMWSCHRKIKEMVKGTKLVMYSCDIKWCSDNTMNIITYYEDQHRPTVLQTECLFIPW